MQFLKKNYEKILLGIVLAGMLGMLVFMIFYIAADKQAMEENVNSLINPAVKPLPNLDLSTNLSAITRLESPYQLDLETSNKVFNPFDWVRTLDNQIVRKSNGAGPQVVVVTNITPLYLVLTLDSVATNELGARYVIGVEKQAAPTPAKRRKQQRFVSMGEKANDTFALVEVKGAPENPESLTCKLVDSGELAIITKDKPFRRVDAYSADFRYDPEKKVFRGQRTGSSVAFGGTVYLVADVNQNELILEDTSNQKKTPLPFSP
jgi:hypothetical protein